MAIVRRIRMRTSRTARGIVYDEHGPGEGARGAALFVHGFASRRNGEKALELARVLAEQGWRLVALDLQGHGESPGRIEDLTIGRSVDDLLETALHAGFFRAPRRALVGSSFGGLVAAWASVVHPQLCDRLALIAPAFGFVARHAPSMRIRSEWVDVTLSRAILDEAPARRDEDLARRLAAPTLILHGERDDAVPIEASRAFARLRPETRLVEVPGGDHRLTAWKETVARTIGAFVASQ